MEHQTTTTTTTTTNNNNNKRHTIFFVKYIHKEDILVERDMQGPDVAQKKLILLLGNDGHSQEKVNKQMGNPSMLFPYLSFYSRHVTIPTTMAQQESDQSG